MNNAPVAGGEWWREGVLYQIYPRSFADSNGDGVGDLRGVTSRLDYLEWLGIDGIWLNPTMPSPNADWGYDVADYCDVHPDLGTLADLDELVAEGEARGIRILLDLVPNHTSDRHPWFVDSRASGTSPRRDWYFWRDPKPDGSPANNWRSVFGEGGPAWKLDGATGQMYLHHFRPEQPDLNWWSEEVRAAFDGVQRFWFDRGVAGFRIDVVSELVKRRDLPDEGGDPQQFGKHADERETHRVLRRWRRLADSYEPSRLLLGETWAMDAPTLASYLGQANDELNLAFNFPFMLAPLDPEIMVHVVEATEKSFLPEARPVWTGSNHDFARFPTRWCEDDEPKVRCALLDALEHGGRGRLHGGGREAVASPRRFRGPQRRESTERSRLDAHARSRSGRAPPRERRSARRLVFDRAEPRGDVGLAARRGDDRGAEHERHGCSRRGRRGDDPDRDRARPRR